MTYKAPPPQRNKTELPILTQLAESYKLWQEFFIRLPKFSRHTMGAKIDSLFVGCIDLSLTAGYAARDEKIILVKKLSVTFDALKFFLKILWETKALDTGNYAVLSVRLEGVGRQLGGWLKNLENQRK